MLLYMSAPRSMIMPASDSLDINEAINQTTKGYLQPKYPIVKFRTNYTEAELFLQRAVELLPLDPIINDHYADTLWMLNKDIQARYFWNYVLNLDSSEQKLKDIVNKKLIFGINKKL